MNGNTQQFDFQSLQRVLGSSLIWVGAAFLLVMALLFSTIRMGRVSGEQVGILLDRISGEMTVINQSGVKIYNGLLSDFHVLDKTLQTLEMTGKKGRGERQGKDDLKIKTVDGSDVYVDMKVQYNIIADDADGIVQTSGLNDNYKNKWARDYIRSICRNHLGELTTEEFYDASKRALKIVSAQSEANEKLNKFGINIASIVIPQRPQFYKEYEEMIKKKKVADQTVLEEESKARAAEQKQKTLVVQETNKKNVAIKRFEGKMQQRIIAADAEATLAKKQADAYYTRVSVSAGAEYYKLDKEAQGIRSRRTAEAEGIMALNKALEGEGGRNLVKLEYARKLKDIKIIGKPFTIRGTIERFEHIKGPASTGRE